MIIDKTNGIALRVKKGDELLGKDGNPVAVVTEAPDRGALKVKSIDHGHTFYPLRGSVTQPPLTWDELLERGVRFRRAET